jgi:anti-sigma-K factor RskA
MKRPAKEKMPDDSDDMIAAEYVLGVLPDEQRAAASARIRDDAGFAQLVNEWTARLSPLDEAYSETAAPASVKRALDARLFASSSVKVPGLWENLGLWRVLAFGAMAIAAVAMIPNLRQPGPAIEVAPIVAPMQAADSGEVRFVALYQPGSDEIRISKVKAEKGADKDFELWLVDEGGAPQSLGVFADASEMRVKLKPEIIAKIDSGDAFAVSIEAKGGSTSGAPSADIIAVGASKAI